MSAQERGNCAFVRENIRAVHHSVFEMWVRRKKERQYSYSMPKISITHTKEELLKELELGGEIIDFEGNLRPNGLPVLKDFISYVYDSAVEGEREGLVTTFVSCCDCDHLITDHDEIVCKVVGCGCDNYDEARKVGVSYKPLLTSQDKRV